MATIDESLIVEEVKDVTQESFGLRYAGSPDEETVLCKDVVAIVPAHGRPDEATLLFIQAGWEANASAPNGNTTEHATAATGSFVNQIATRRIPRSGIAALARYAIPTIPPYLQGAGDRQLHIIISVKSGACDGDDFFARIVRPVLSRLGFSEGEQWPGYRLHRTTSERSILDLAANTFGPQANRGVPQTILLLTGDGGVIDVINGISVSARTPQFIKPVIGLLALGTGNALASSSGLNNDGTKGLSSFLRGSPKPLPTFRAAFSPGTEILSNEGRTSTPIPLRDAIGRGILFGVVVASWCLHASLVADSDTTEFRKHGSERFAMAAHELLEPSDGSEPHLYQGKITLRQQSGGGAEYVVNWERQNHMYFLATFVSNLEKTLNISPRAKPLDGQLRIIHFGKLPAADIMSIFALAYDGGRHTELDVVGYEPVEGFRIDFHEADPRWRRVCVDGKIVRVGENGWMEVSKVADEFVELVTDA
jgi:diacylglycerol kinase family enzyme